MNEEISTNVEIIDNLIDEYSSVQRIIKAENPKKEAEYQLKLIKVKLESIGIRTTDLNLE